MTKQDKQTFIVDACVMIDYMNADISILGLFAGKFGNVVVALDTLIEEVKGLDVASCYRAGISIYEPSTEQLKAAGIPRGQLSFHDRLLFLLARDNGWTTITNDTDLTGACRQIGVSVIRGLRPLIELVNTGDVTRKEAESLVKQMIAANKHLDKWLLKEFKKEVGVRPPKRIKRRRRR